MKITNTYTKLTTQSLWTLNPPPPTPNLPSFPRGSKHSPSHQNFNTEIHRINFNVLHALSSLSRCDDIDNNF